MSDKEKENMEQTENTNDSVDIPNDNSDDVIISQDDDNSDNNDDNSEEEIMDPLDEINDLKASIADLNEKHLRSLANMDNLRKRCRRDMEEARKNGRTNVIENLLPALDSIDMALKSIEPTDENKAIYDGMIMVQKQFLSSMTKFELKMVETDNATFDPALHEAVSYVPSEDHDSGEIMTEMRKGYMLGDRLIRASMVVVSSGPFKQEEHEDEPSTEPDEVNED